jgi:hypothetical protein
MPPLRPQLFTARMTREEISMVQQLAAEDGISASDFVRQFIRRAYVERHGALKTARKAPSRRAKAGER